MEGEVIRSDPTDEAYDRLEKNAIDALNEMFESDKMTKGQAMKAKVAQGALASVQSHQKAKMTRRTLDFAMARALTTDPEKMAEYIRLTQPDSALVKAIPATLATRPRPVVEITKAQA